MRISSIKGRGQVERLYFFTSTDRNDTKKLIVSDIKYLYKLLASLKTAMNVHVYHSALKTHAIQSLKIKIVYVLLDTFVKPR